MAGCLGTRSMLPKGLAGARRLPAAPAPRRRPCAVPAAAASGRPAEVSSGVTGVPGDVIVTQQLLFTAARTTKTGASVLLQEAPRLALPPPPPPKPASGASTWLARVAAGVRTQARRGLEGTEIQLPGC